MFHSNKVVNWDLNTGGQAPESFFCMFFHLTYATNSESGHSGHVYSGRKLRHVVVKELTHTHKRLRAGGTTQSHPEAIHLTSATPTACEVSITDIWQGHTQGEDQWLTDWQAMGTARSLRN